MKTISALMLLAFLFISGSHVHSQTIISGKNGASAARTSESTIETDAYAEIHAGIATSMKYSRNQPEKTPFNKKP